MSSTLSSLTWWGQPWLTLPNETRLARFFFFFFFLLKCKYNLASVNSWAPDNRPALTFATSFHSITCRDGRPGRRWQSLGFNFPAFPRWVLHFFGSFQVSLRLDLRGLESFNCILSCFIFYAKIIGWHWWQNAMSSKLIGPSAWV